MVRWSNEPVLLSAIVAGVLVAAATVLLLLDGGATGLHAAAVGLLELATVIGGGKIARGRAYGPETVDRILDADAVLAAHEGE